MVLREKIFFEIGVFNKKSGGGAPYNPCGFVSDMDETKPSRECARMVRGHLQGVPDSLI